MSPYLVTIIFFTLTAVAAACFLASAHGREHSLEERFSDLSLKMRVVYGALKPDEIEERSFVRALFRWARERLPEPDLDTAEGRKMARLLVVAGYTGSAAVHTFQLVRLLGAILGTFGAMGGAIATNRSGFKLIVAMVIGAAAGAWIPFYLVQRRAKNRQQKIGTQLSDVLDLLVVCVEAGLGIAESIKIVGQQCERQGQEIGRELAMVSAELNAGSSLGQALRGLAERTNVEDIKPLAATMIQSEQLGAQMGPALRSISDGLRSTRKLRAEEAAQKTAVKMLFPLVFFALPSMMSVIVGPAMLQIMRTLSNYQ